MSIVDIKQGKQKPGVAAAAGPVYRPGMKRVAVMCVLRGPEGFLLLKRAKPPHVGHYVPVGGHLENFESPREAVVREVAEETGIDIEIPKLKGIVTETCPEDYNWIVYVYSAKIPGIKPASCPEGKLEWIWPEELDGLPVPEIDRYVYRYLRAGKFFVFEAFYDRDLKLTGLRDELNGEDIIEGSGLKDSGV